MSDFVHLYGFSAVDSIVDEVHLLFDWCLSIWGSDCVGVSSHRYGCAEGEWRSTGEPPCPVPVNPSLSCTLSMQLLLLPLISCFLVFVCILDSFASADCIVCFSLPFSCNSSFPFHKDHHRLSSSAHTQSSQRARPLSTSLSRYICPLWILS